MNRSANRYHDRHGLRDDLALNLELPPQTGERPTQRRCRCDRKGEHDERGDLLAERVVDLSAAEATEPAQPDPATPEHHHEEL